MPIHRLKLGILSLALILPVAEERVLLTFLCLWKTRFSVVAGSSSWWRSWLVFTYPGVLGCEAFSVFSHFSLTVKAGMGFIPNHQSSASVSTAAGSPSCLPMSSNSAADCVPASVLCKFPYPREAESELECLGGGRFAQRVCPGVLEQPRVLPGYAYLHMGRSPSVQAFFPVLLCFLLQGEVMPYSPELWFQDLLFIRD